MSWKLKEKYLEILSGEEGYYKKAWGDSLKICLAYPNTYRTGMSSLGFQTVYDLFNRHPRCLCERVFLPDREDEEEFRKGAVPLFSLESQRPIADFDILAFSLSFENDYPNVLKILAMGGISLLSYGRRESEPLILGGGIAATLNPEPLTDFLDLFILGEGEEAIPRFLDLLTTAGPPGLAREELLFHLQREIQGVYVPRFYTVSYGAKQLISGRRPVDESLPATIKAGHLPDINSFQTEQRIAAADTELGRMSLLEVSRGCSRGCRFCAAGFVCRPVRFRDAPLLEASILKYLEQQKKIGLLGAAVSDHPDLISLCRFVGVRGGTMAIGSLRMDRLDPELVRLLREGGAETLSLAPEAGSGRLRDLIKKGISEEQIFHAVEVLADQGIPNIRLYFMVGLPSEEDEDVEAVIELTKKIKHCAVKHAGGKRPFKRIVLSVNQFIPKAATPFQWHPLEDINGVKRKIRRIERALYREPSVKVIHDLPKWNYIQALLSLGDRRVGEILLAAHRCDGNWPRAMKEVNVNPDFYVYRRKDTSEILPWDFIDHGVSKSILLREYEQALKINFKPAADCYEG